MKRAIKRIILLSTTIASFLTSFMGSSINVALPAIGNEFKLSAIILGWITSSYLLSSAMVLIVAGRIADLFGRKKIFLLGIILFTITSILSALSPYICFLIGVRILQGLGAAMMFSTSTAMIISVFPFNERGKVLGINVSSVYIGLTLGPFLGGLITHYFGWRILFLIPAILGFIDIIILSNIKGDWSESKDEKFDYSGSILSALTILLLVLGFSNLPKIIGWIYLLVSIAGIFAFIYLESRFESPLINIDLFSKSKTFAFSNIAALINYSATFSISFLLSLYLQKIKGFSSQMAGLVLIAQPIVMALFSPIAGKLSDKKEPQIIATIGMSLTFIGLLFLANINLQSSLVYIIFCLIFIGIGLALFSSPNTNAIMSSVSKKYYGVASGIVSSMRIIGQMLSMAIVMMIISIFLRNSIISDQNKNLFLKSIKISFITFAILCFFGIFFSLARGKMRTNNY